VIVVASLSFTLSNLFTCNFSGLLCEIFDIVSLFTVPQELFWCFGAVAHHNWDLAFVGINRWNFCI